MHRRHIDRIDLTIVALLGERMRLGRSIGRLKRAGHGSIRSTVREAAVLARVRQAAADPLSSQAAERIFCAIIEETAACQERDDA
jgi:chorismate mutase